MTEPTDIVFLGVNDAGRRVYDWLCQHPSAFVHALITEKEQLNLVETVEPEYIVSCGYRHVVPESILNVPTEGCLNLHPAYLPYNRGANPNVWSIVEGTPAGVTLHYMDSGIDTGAIIDRRRVETSFADTGKDLYERLKDAQVDLFRETWPAIIERAVTTTEQDSEAGTSHRTEEFEELCQLDPDETIRVKRFLDRLRALTFPPYENAKIQVGDDTYYVDIEIKKA